jgi:hypothetical protein
MNKTGKNEIERRVYFGTRRFVERFLEFCKDNSIYFPKYIILHLIREQELVLKYYPKNIETPINIVKDQKEIDQIYKKKKENIKLSENEKSILEIFEIREKIKATLNLSLQFLKARDDNNYDLKEIYQILTENKDILKLKRKSDELEEQRNKMYNKLIKQKNKNVETEKEIERMEHSIFEIQEKQFNMINGNISFIMGLLFLVFLSKEFEVLPHKKIEELQHFIEKRWKVEQTFQLY